MEERFKKSFVALDRNGNHMHEGDIVTVFSTNEDGEFTGQQHECLLIFHDGKGYMHGTGFYFARADHKFEQVCIDEESRVWYAESTGMNKYENPHHFKLIPEL